MHISVGSAALLAQVFPTLLLAILIEGRFTFTSKKRAWRMLLDMGVRILAIFSLATATYICLLSVIGNYQGLMLDISVMIAFFASFVGVLLMISDVVERQLEESKNRWLAEGSEDLAVTPPQGRA